MSNPVSTRVGLGPIYGLFWPIRLVLRITVSFWYILVRSIIPVPILALLPRILLPPSAHGRVQSDVSNLKPFLKSLREDYTTLSVDLATLPKFHSGTYKEYLRMLRLEAKLGLVILCCAEHQDDDMFKREVLINEEFGRVLRDKDVTVWAGDIREREPFQVAQTLQVTTYPSLTFFSLIPPSSHATGTQSSTSTSSAKLAILTTISGSPKTTTSLPSILHLLNTTILPRSQPFLTRVKRDRRILEENRKVKQEQDKRTEESARKDRDRIMASRRERDARERREREESEKIEREALDASSKVERARKISEDRIVWRRYLRKTLSEAPEIPIENVKAGKAVRVQIRIPGGGSAKHIRVFDKNQASTSELFRWAETLLVPHSDLYSPDSDPDTPPSDFEEPYPFNSALLSTTEIIKLFTTYPRKEIVFDSEGWNTVVQGGGNLFLEVENGQASSDMDSDYETDQSGSEQA